MSPEPPPTAPVTTGRQPPDSIFRPDGIERRPEPPSSSAPLLDSGSTLGDYRLTRRLGTGGMGTVWEAEQCSLRRMVALKVIQPERVDERSIKLFAREARAGGKLHHKGLVAVHATGEHDGVHFIAQELVGEGHTLADVVTRLTDVPTLPPGYYEQVADFVADVCDAMQAAHDAGVIHRDLKPANILIDEQGNPKVTDFGLARILEERSLSAPVGLLGTFFYMSPEQAAAKVIGIDHRTDIFSLGVILYELLTLRRPFEGDTETQILEKILYQDPVAPRRARSRVPLELSVICMKALEKHRDQRYSTMAELAADLRRFRAHEPIRARPPGTMRRAHKWTLRHRAWAASLTVGVVAFLVVVALLSAIWQANRDLKESQKTLGIREKSERQARLLAEQRNQDYQATANIKKLADLLREERELWPARAQLLPRIDDWLTRARSLRAARPEVAEVLARLEHPPDTESQEDTAVEAAAWLQQQLVALLDGVDSFADQEFRSVEARRLRATTIEAETVDRYAGDWTEAILAIQESDHYGGLDLPEQVGLVPLGPNELGYWEFWHVESGARPETDEETGRVMVTDESGAVLVLIPGATFWMGSQDEDPDLPNHDPAHVRDELLHEVVLDPYFLSKFEMTQGQWERILGPGSNPSNFGPAHHWVDSAWPRHPVEQVNWEECRDALHRVGLVLPTEAQWECAARASTGTPWSSGAGKDSLKQAANLADHAFNLGFTTPIVPEDWNDGFPTHAPVGSFEPNGFGLFDVHGNVWEWCSGWYSFYDCGHRPGDGAFLFHPDGTDTRYRVGRGGSFSYPAVGVRSAVRRRSSPESRDYGLGCRPAKVIEQRS